MSPKETTYVSLRRLASALLLASATAIAGNTVGSPATACAAPEWDIGSYDSCIKSVVERNLKGLTNDTQMLDEAKHCCSMSGGVWDIHAGGPNGACVAPAAAPTRPPLPPGVATHTLEPAAPVEPAPPPVNRVPAGVIPTFTPVPVG
jgi:hypothetical protein